MRKNKMSLYRPKEYNPECIHKLRDWLNRRGVSGGFLCKMIDIDPSYLSLIMSGKRNVTYTFWRKIVRFSKEELKYNDWDKQYCEPTDPIGDEEVSVLPDSPDHYEDIDI